MVFERLSGTHAAGRTRRIVTASESLLWVEKHKWEARRIGVTADLPTDRDPSERSRLGRGRELHETMALDGRSALGAARYKASVRQLVCSR